MRSVILLVLAPAALFAQADTSRARRDTAATLEAVTVSAIRGRGEAPISQKTLELRDIEERHHGQDIPLLLQGTPSLTIKSETGTPWGYSYIRLRGMEHRRINFTLDGIPLNDPEDHVLYFADFPDLGNSIQSAQLQRGVGTSSNGVAAYAGSVNLESVSLATSRQGLDAQLQTGAFDSHRGSAEYTSGMVAGQYAFYARASALRTNGYRRHAGIEGRSGFFSGAWFGERSVVKLIATAGLFADTMAYTGSSLAEIAQDRRHNPLRPDETDRFAEQVAGLTYIRSFDGGASLSTMLYRVSAGGAFDVCIDRCDQPVADLWRFHLDFGWYGLTSTWSYERAGMRLDFGVNGNTYARDHHAYARPDLESPLYFNTGHKRDASGFTKASWDLGRATVFADVQARAARFRYEPDANAGIPERDIDWRFLNPKAGVTYRVRPGLQLYASYGVNTREPSREDMFAGFDNLDTTNVSFVGTLDRVAPERAHDLEAGLRVQGARVTLQANVFDMRFHNEILPIGELSYIGTPLRKNVPRSYRRGLELDGTLAAGEAWELSANATLMTSLIREYTDRDGNSYRDVPALLTPRFQSAQRVTWRPLPGVTLTAEGRHTARSQLTNTNDPGLVLPADYVVDGRVAWRFGRYEASLFGGNLGDSRGYSTGNVSSSGTPRYFVLAPRNVHLMVRALF
ncbi:MAG TPA: TonB-dependent receptor [Gemmatimonadaceae bacterium]|nr:TonB-dependent receptor [Gemmatimonadaceae bacterium]